MRRLAFLLGCLLGAAQAQAQINARWAFFSPQTYSGSWDLDGMTSHVSPHPAGGYLAVCPDYYSGPAGRVYVTRLDEQGNYLWGKSTVVRPAQNILSRGKFAHDAQGNVLLADPFSLVKLSPDGDTVWTRKLDPTLSTFTTQPVVGPDGNYVLVYQSQPLGTNTVTLTAQKFDAATGRTPLDHFAHGLDGQHLSWWLQRL
jgi:hypothetical protein